MESDFAEFAPPRAVLEPYLGVRVCCDSLDDLYKCTEGIKYSCEGGMDEHERSLARPADVSPLKLALSGHTHTHTNTHTYTHTQSVIQRLGENKGYSYQQAEEDVGTRKSLIKPYL